MKFATFVRIAIFEEHLRTTASDHSTLSLVPYMHKFHHSHKKRKDSLEGSLDRVLFAAELEFLKILVPRLHQHTSYVNTECARKSKQLYSLYVSSFLEH